MTVLDFVVGAAVFVAGFLGGALAVSWWFVGLLLHDIDEWDRQR